MYLLEIVSLKSIMGFWIVQRKAILMLQLGSYDSWPEGSLALLCVVCYIFSIYGSNFLLNILDKAYNNTNAWVIPSMYRKGKKKRES